MSEISYINSYIWNLENRTDEPIHKEEMEMHIETGPVETAGKGVAG